jgi:hypothetical protein
MSGHLLLFILAIPLLTAYKPDARAWRVPTEKKVSGGMPAFAGMTFIAPSPIRSGNCEQRAALTTNRHRTAVDITNTNTYDRRGFGL